MTIYSRAVSVITATIKIYPKRSAAAVLVLIGVALMDALSVISLIPAIEYLGKATETSHFTRVIQELFRHLGIAPSLVSYFALAGVIITAKSCLRYLAKRLLVSIQMDFEVRLGSRIADGLLHGELGFVEAQERGRVLGLMTLEVQKIGECLFYVYDLAALGLKFLFYFSLLMSFSPGLVAVIFLTSGLTFLPSLLVSRRLYAASQLRLQGSGQVTDHIGRLQAGLIELKAYAAEVFSLNHFKRELEAFKRNHGRMLLLQEMNSIVLEPFGVLQIILIVYLALNWFQLNFAEALIVLFSLRNTLPLFGQMMTYKQVILTTAPSFEAVQELQRNLDQHRENHGGAELTVFDRLSVSDLSHSYRTVRALDGVSFELKRGESLALVGPSGSGKSTLMKALLGLIRPEQGRVLVNGVSVFEASIGSWRRLVAYVPQEPILLKDTLARNVAIGEAAVDPERLRRAIAGAHLTDVVARLPQGVETLLGGNAAALSSGQKQRLALARALYKDAPLILLDEPTSALDMESESGIRRTIEALKGSKTFIVIAHRLNTIQFCDRVLVLEQGRVVESGTPAELARQHGTYAKLLNAQGAH